MRETLVGIGDGVVDGGNWDKLFDLRVIKL